MNPHALRPLASLAGFIVAYVVAWMTTLLLLPGVGFWHSLLPLSLATAFSIWIWRALARPDPGLAARILAPTAIGGATGFVLGFFGPMLLVPGANQGPLLGLFVTGPAGALIGLIVGLVRARR